MENNKLAKEVNLQRSTEESQDFRFTVRGPGEVMKTLPLRLDDQERVYSDDGNCDLDRRENN